MSVNERIGAESGTPKAPQLQWPRQWALAFVFVFLLLGMLGDFAHIVQFAWNSASAAGEVVAVEPENHNRVRVRYSVSGREYEVASSYKPTTVSGPAKFTVGQSLKIYYLRSMPGNASLQPPTELLSSAFTQAALLAALGASFITWLIHDWKRPSPRV